MHVALRMLIALLGFGLPAYFVSRLKLTAREGGGKPRQVSWAEASELKTKATRSYINRLMLKMSWAWVFITALVLAYEPGEGINYKIYAVVLWGCILFGLILASVTYSHIENFKTLEPDILAGFAEMEKDPQRFMEEYARDSKKKALKAVRAGNQETMLVVIFETIFIGPVYLLAMWVEGLSFILFVVFLGVALLLTVLLYLGLTFRFS